LEPFQHDQRIAGVFGRQVPLVEHLANPIVRAMAAKEYPAFFDDEPYVSDADHRFSNSNAAIRVSAWRENPFDEDAGFGEDQIWSREILKRGFLIAYQPQATVYHSHPDSFSEFYRRQLACEKEFRRQGFSESDRRLRRLVGRQWNVLRRFLADVARSRSIRGIHWDAFRTEIVSNWAWYRAGRDMNQNK
jgi:rhamnosyltransferase